jgi:hypothetical protein
MKLLERSNPWLDLAVFEDLDAGRKLESFLTSEGFRARTYDDKIFRYFLSLRPPRVTYRVQVPADEFQSAGDVLAGGTPAALQRALRCPSCASLRVSYPQMTRKFMLPTILLHLGIIFRVIEHECYCEHCHFIWELLGARAITAARTRAHFPFGAVHPKPAATSRRLRSLGETFATGQSEWRAERSRSPD